MPNSQSTTLATKLLAWTEAYGIALPQNIYNLCQEILKPREIHHTGGFSNPHTETSD